MINLYKMMFFTLLLSSTLISISSYSWIGMWIGLEINLLAIIPLMHNKHNIMSSEASIKYFITQAIASSAILMSMIMLIKNFNFTSNLDFSSSMLMIMNSSLLTKMGMAPFHFWFPEIMEGLTWMNCMLILTWQKIMPMSLLMFNLLSNQFLINIILISLILSSLMSMNQMSIRKLLAFSSINNMGWMMAMMMMNKTIWMFYFLIYSMLTIMMITILNHFQIYLFNQLFLMNNNPLIKIMFNLNFLSLMGLPPLLGFMPKWLTIQVLIENKMYFLTVIMIVTTLWMIFVYLRMMSPSILIYTNQMNWTQYKILPSFKIALYNFFMLTSLIYITLFFSLV